MKNPTFAILLTVTSCLATPIEDAAPEDEAVAEAGQSLRAEPMQRNSVEGLPAWHIFLGGRDLHSSAGGEKTYYTHPDQSDYRAPLIFVRDGEENEPERWVQLDAHASWMTGDAYFDKLVECGGVSPLDLLVMQSVLQAFEGESEPPDIHTLPAAHGPNVLYDLKVRSHRICSKPKTWSSPEDGEHVGEARSAITEGGDYNPLPRIPTGPGDDHTGPAPGGRKPDTSVPQGRPTPKPRPGGRDDSWVVSGIPNDGRPHGPRVDPSPEVVRDKLNGLLPGDPPPAPFENPRYEPGPGEQEETFRCTGTVYRGFKGGCVDFSNESATSKWGRRIDGWAQRFDPSRIAMKPEERVNLCKTALAIVGWTGCLAAVGACGTADALTFGTLTIPCIWINGFICGAHAAAGQLVDCNTLVGK